MNRVRLNACILREEIPDAARFRLMRSHNNKNRKEKGASGIQLETTYPEAKPARSCEAVNRRMKPVRRPW